MSRRSAGGVTGSGPTLAARVASGTVSVATALHTTDSADLVQVATAATNTPADTRTLRSRPFAGVSVESASNGSQVSMVTAGPLDRSVADVGPGVECAVGTSTTGTLVRATDSSCASAPNWVGDCNAAGTITVRPRRADSLNVVDFGADPRGALGIIASSTNASPIVVTTSVAHGLQTGQRVNIASHTTNTAANGLWTITVTGATTFTLGGSTGNGVGGASGTIQVDSTPAFLAAMKAFNPAELDLAGRIRVPPGAYLIADVRIDRPVIIEGDGGTASPLYAAARIDVPGGKSGFIFTVNAQRSVVRHLQINALARNTTSGTGATTALVENAGAAYTLTMASGASNFAVGDRIRVHGAGWRNNYRSGRLSLTSGSAVATITQGGGTLLYNHGLYVGQWLYPASGFAAPVQIVSLDAALATVTLSTTSSATAAGVEFDHYGDVFTEIVAKNGNTITMLSSADSTRSGVLVEHADTGIVFYGGCRAEHCAVKSFQGPGVHVHGNHADQYVTNANLWYLACVDVHFNLHGVFVDGIDGNAGVGTMIIGNGNRLFTIYDDSFLGNSWIQCHSAPYAGDVAPFRGFASRDFSFTRASFIACYVEDGSSQVFGRGTNTFGGFMNKNPGGHAMVDGCASNFQVGDVTDYSEVQTVLGSGGWSDVKAIAIKARGQTEFVLRRTSAGDGAAGMWGWFGASAAGKVVFAWADADAVAPFNDRQGSIWFPYGLRIGGGEANGTLDPTKAKRIEYSTAAPYGEAGKIGDMRINATYTPGYPHAWRCVATGTAGTYGAGGVAVWRALKNEPFELWVTTSQNVYVDDLDYAYYFNAAGATTCALGVQLYAGKKVLVSSRGGGTVTIDGGAASIVGGSASGTTLDVPSGGIRVVRWNGSWWDVVQ